MRQYCEDVCEREEGRQAANRATQRAEAKSQRCILTSLAGHVSLAVSKGGRTVFSQTTFMFLESHDLVKLLQLSKEYRSDLLAKNSSVFASHVYCGRISQMATRLDQWTGRNNDRQRQLSLFEAKDKARNSLL